MSKHEDFQRFAAAVAELNSAARLLGMKGYAFSVTPTDFIRLKEYVAKYDSELWSKPDSMPVSGIFALMPLKVQW